MTTETEQSNPYAAAIADLRAKRDEIDNTIRILEQLSGLKLVSGGSGDLQFSASGFQSPIEETAGMFLGMSIVDATKKLLAMRKRTMGNPEIVRELKEGGMALTAKEPVNVVGSVLTRRFNEVGDVVKVGRGIWGLKEWYPGRTFKAKSNGNSERPEEAQGAAEEPLDLDEVVKSDLGLAG